MHLTLHPHDAALVRIVSARLTLPSIQVIEFTIHRTV